jgi:serine/threonine protein kinase/Tfp pilus assembly protein PilF
MICSTCGLDNPEERADCAGCGACLTGDGKSSDPGPPTRAGDKTMPIAGQQDAADGAGDRTVGLPDASGGGQDSAGDPSSRERGAPEGTAGWSMPPPSIEAQTLGAGQSTLPTGVVLAGRYEIVTLLGEGGMGAVYRAQDRELERPVALKVIRPELATQPSILQRFKQELILARAVTHSNVVRIFDLGTSDGIKFITMEFVEGRDLKSLILEGRRFSPDEATEIVRQICLALKAAHDAGIVHRDLKPHNIMMDAAGQAKVMDFGVARSMETTGLTQTGQMIGTPDYMSPEQAKGEPADVRSDLFSLGIILYELLVGQVPYQAETPFGALLKRTQEPAVPPAKTQRDVPEYLNDIVVKCLQIDRELRYQSAQEILEDIEARRRPEMPSPLALLRHRLRRVQPVTLALSLALIVVVLATATFLLTGNRPGPAAEEAQAEAVEIEPVSLAILPFRNSTGDPEVAWLQSSLAEMLRSDIGQSARLRTVTSDRVHQILSDLKIDPSANLDPATIRRLADHGNAQLVLSGQYSKIGEQIRIDATLHDLDRQRSAAVKTAAANEAELLTAIGQLAQSVRENMDLSADAIRELEEASFAPSSASIDALRSYNDGLQLQHQGNYVEALDAFEAAVESDSQFALAHAKLAQVFADLGRDGEGQQASRTAMELSEGLPDFERYLIRASHAMVLNDHEQAIAAYERLAERAPADPQIQFNLAGLYEQTGELDQARDRLEKVLRNDPNYVDALYALGRVSIRGGNPQQALEPLNRALSLAVQAGNEDGRGRVLHAVGIAYKRLGRLDEALRNYRDSLEIRRKLDQKSGVAAGLAEVANVQLALGNLDEAHSSLDEALGLRREIGDRAGIGISLLGLGDFHLDLGQYDDALRHYKDALRIHRELGDGRSEALCLNNIGVVYLDRGEFGDALTNLEQALLLREKTSNPYELGETLFNLGETSSALGRYDQALDYYLRALEQMRASQDHIGVAATQHGIGIILGRQGRFRASLESLEDAAAELEQSGDRGYWRAVVSARHGAALGAAGRLDESRAVLDGAAKLAEDLQNRSVLAQIESFRGWNDYYEGRLVQAAARFDAALSHASAADDRRARMMPSLGLARVALAGGRADEAAALLEPLLREANDLGLMYDAAESSVLLAEALLERGDRQGARDRLLAALTDLERSQLRLLLARCRQLLGRIEVADGNPESAARHHAQARRILDEIRDEAGDEDPFRRRDLESMAAELGAAGGDG